VDGDNGQVVVFDAHPGLHLLSGTRLLALRHVPLWERLVPLPSDRDQ
jgi:hypothetical protein